MSACLGQKLKTMLLLNEVSILQTHFHLKELKVVVNNFGKDGIIYVQYFLEEKVDLVIINVKKNQTYQLDKIIIQ